jgi:hypothetical protein
LQKITQEIIKNGIAVFFPSDKECREYFLQMIEDNTREKGNVDSPKEKESTSQSTGACFKYQATLSKASGKLLFEAFCSLFCSNKTNIIQHLITEGKSVFDSCLDLRKILELLEKMIRLSFRLNESASVHLDERKLVTSLVDLIDSIQSSLFYNMRECLLKSNNSAAAYDQPESSVANLLNFLQDYTKLLVAKSEILFKSSTKLNSAFNMKNFFTKLVYNFILWLAEIFPLLTCSVCTSFIQVLIHFQASFQSLSAFFQTDEKVF